MDVGPQDAIRFRTHRFEYIALSNVFERGSERSPEIFADASVFLPGECLEGRLEFARGFVVFILLPVNKR